jgi:hypothetical protein
MRRERPNCQLGRYDALLSVLLVMQLNAVRAHSVIKQPVWHQD